MPVTWDEIVAFVEERRSADDPLLTEMIAVRDHYNGDIVVPLVDVKTEPTVAAAVPALVADAVDGTAMRAASVRPTIIVPAVDPTSVRSRERARDRRRAWYAAWHDSALDDVLLGAMYRHMTAYGTGCLYVLPDFATGRARIEVRDPLGVYADHRTPHDTGPPLRVAALFARSAGWIRRAYGDRVALPSTARDGDTWEVVEYVDGEVIVIGVIGPRLARNWDPLHRTWPTGGREVRRWPNLADGMTPVALPHRMSLSRIQGQVASMVPIVNLMAHMTALDVIAAEKAVFADMVVYGQNGAEPRLVTGSWRDGRTGEPNIVVDGKVDLLHSQPGVMTDNMLNRLERAARTRGGNPAMLQGELYGSLRSGQTVSALAGVAVDPVIQEAQRLGARALTVVNQAVAAVERGYFPTRKVVAFSGWSSDEGEVSYTPQVLWGDSDRSVVRYAFPGMDATSLASTVAGLVGAELMSHRSARAAHPFIEDNEMEERAILGERVETAVLQGFLAQATSGAIALVDLARIMELYGETGELVTAIIDAQREAQERQARQAPPPDPGSGFAVPPETQPGLGVPGQGIEEVPPTVPPLSPSLGNFRELANALSARIRTPAGGG